MLPFFLLTLLSKLFNISGKGCGIMGDSYKTVISKVIRLSPLLMIAGFLPFFLRIAVIQPVPSDYFIFDITGPLTDWYLYYRVQLNLAMASVALLFAMGIALTEQRWNHFNRLLIPLFIYLGMVFLSGFLSEHQDMVYRGAIDRFEGVWTHVAYVCTALGTYFLMKDRDDVKFLLRVVLGASFFVSFYALLQMLDCELLNWPMVQALIIPQYLKEAGSNTFQVVGRMICSTLNNPNFLSQYCGIITALSGVLIVERTENPLFSWSVFVMSAIAMFGTLSTNGLIGFYAALNVFIFLKEQIDGVAFKGVVKVMLSLVVIMPLALFIRKNSYFDNTIVVIVMTVASIAHGFIRYKLLKEIKKYRILFIGIVSIAMASALCYAFLYKGNDRVVEDVQISGNSLIFKVTDEEVFTLENINDNTIRLLENEKELAKAGIGSTVTYHSKGIGELNIDFQKAQELQYIEIKPLKVLFIVAKGSFYFVDARRKSVDIQYPEHYGFIDNEKFGSTRGYIWSRSLPIALDSWLVGKGPDAFLLEFPQYDVAGKINAGLTATIVDKPHSWYLSLIINLGGMAFVSMIGLYLTLIKKSVSTKEPLLLSTFSGLTAYYAAGVFVDSIPSLAPLLWLLIGIAIYLSVNQNVDKSQMMNKLNRTIKPSKNL